MRLQTSRGPLRTQSSRGHRVRPFARSTFVQPTTRSKAVSLGHWLILCFFTNQLSFPLKQVVARQFAKTHVRLGLSLSIFSNGPQMSKQHNLGVQVQYWNNSWFDVLV